MKMIRDILKELAPPFMILFVLEIALRVIGR